ncbi:translation initiation factor IF-2 [Folsomia candida]|uniref:translation initiation factor IF-2 n=1 Tax=Folsomia candida TaxID=158441 RepID=UPI000B8FE023|nr:translation initiation factor IF-2 [Folsomia candida]
MNKSSSSGRTKHKNEDDKIIPASSNSKIFPCVVVVAAAVVSKLEPPETALGPAGGNSLWTKSIISPNTTGSDPTGGGNRPFAATPNNQTTSPFSAPGTPNYQSGGGGGYPTSGSVPAAGSPFTPQGGAASGGGPSTPCPPPHYAHSPVPSGSSTPVGFNSHGPPHGGGQFNPQSGLYNGPGGPNSPYFNNFPPNGGGPPPRPRNNSFPPYPNQGPFVPGGGGHNNNFVPPPFPSHHYSQQQIPPVRLASSVDCYRSMLFSEIVETF